MRKMFVLAAAVAAAASVIVVGSASAEAAFVFSQEQGVGWIDANGALIIVPDANVHYVFTNNPDGSYNIRANGTLPDGTALPDKAQHVTLADTPFVGCLVAGDSLKGVNTPSGKFSFECKGEGVFIPKP